MNILIHNILEGMQTIWNNQVNVSTLVPGGLWFARVPQDTAIPYGIVQMEEGQKSFVSSGDFIQKFRVSVSIYSAGGPGSSNAKFLAGLVGEAFDFCQNEFSFSNGRVIDFMPSSNSLQLQDGLRDAEDVLLTTASWEVTAQGKAAIS